MDPFFEAVMIPHAAQPHMNPFMVLGLVVLAVLMAETITRVSLAIQSWFYTKITRRRPAPKPASVEEVYELLKVIADRQGNILRYLAELKEFHEGAESILNTLVERDATVHNAQTIQLSELLQANRASLLALKDISDKLENK